MQYRELGNSGLRVSEIGFGGWGIGGWGPVDDAAALSALDLAYDLGVTFYDTALGYGDGHSEELIGKAFRDRRDKVIIASKLPPKTDRWPVKPNDPLYETFPASWIIAKTEESLRQLGTDYLDVQQLHAWTDPYTYLDEWREAFLLLKKQG
jgi:aryl-alcohol dehydrogenase-like predicted oxidoreductase